MLYKDPKKKYFRFGKILAIPVRSIVWLTDSMGPGWPVAQILGVTRPVGGVGGGFSTYPFHRSRVVPLLRNSCYINLFSFYVTWEYRPFIALEGGKVGI